MSAQNRRQTGPHHIVEAHLRGDRIAHGLNEMFRVANAPRDVAFDDQVLLVAREKFARPRIVHTQSAVEIGDALERPLGMQARGSNGPDRLAELGDQRKFGFADGEECQPREQDESYCRSGAIVFLYIVHNLFLLSRSQDARGSNLDAILQQEQMTAPFR